MNIRYLIISLKQTIYFFVRKKKYDFVIYSPSYFVIEGKHLHFNSLINFFRKNNISFLYVEEPYKRNSKRSINAYYFDFIFFLIVFFRKIISGTNHISIDKKIARLLRPLIRFKCKNIITISQSMISFFSELDNDANIFDLQHGIIHKDKTSYLVDGNVSSNIIFNNAKVLLFSEKYKRILVDNEKGNYYKDNTIVVGNYLNKTNFLPKSNFNVIVSLQFTDSHNLSTNNIILTSLLNTIKNNKKYSFYLLEHPRKNEFDISELTKLSNTKLVSENKNDLIKNCSIHYTCYSTMAIDLAFQGIPTVFTDTKFSKKFIKDFDYPLDLNFNEVSQNFDKFSNEIREWSYQYFSKYSYDKLIHFI